MLRLAGPGLCLVLHQPNMREIWVLTSLLVAVEFPLQGKERNVHLSEQDASEALPKNTRALPQSTYGHQIWCIPPTSMKRLRAAAACMDNLGRLAGMCTTTLVAITKTETASRLHAEVITEYLVFLRDDPLQTKRIERAWQLLLRRFERTARKRRWFQLTVFLSNVIAILLELEWKPVTATHWINDLKDSWTFNLSKTFEVVPIVRDTERASMRYLWRAASLHRHGESLAAVAQDLTVLRRHLHSHRHS